MLATIDDRDYVAALDQAKADIAGAQADINNLKASLDQQQAVIAQARDTVNLDQANLTYAQQENDRYTTLANHDATSVELEAAGDFKACSCARYARARHCSRTGG